MDNLSLILLLNYFSPLGRQWGAFCGIFSRTSSAHCSFPDRVFHSLSLFETFGILLKRFLLKGGFLNFNCWCFDGTNRSDYQGNQAQTAAKLLFTNGSDLNKLIELHEDYATLTLFYFSAVLFLRTYLVIKKKI